MNRVRIFDGYAENLKVALASFKRNFPKSKILEIRRGMKLTNDWKVLKNSNFEDPYG